MHVTCVVEAIDPLLGHRLDAFYGPDVVRLAIVVPCVDLHEVHCTAILNQAFPALREQPVVSSVDEILVVCICAIVLLANDVSCSLGTMMVES